MAYVSHESQALRGNRYLHADGRVVAELTPDGVLDRYKWYILYKPEPAIGYNLDLLAEAEQLGAAIARNRDEHRGIAHVAPISRIREFGYERDFGFGLQIFLSLPYWDVVNTDGTLVERAKLPGRREAMQGSLETEIA